jgi:Arc/MetJ family transcription regulator
MRTRAPIFVPGSQPDAGADNYIARHTEPYYDGCMTTLTVRTDSEVDQALAALTADGTSTSDAVRAAILAAYRERYYAELRTAAEEAAHDPDDLAEVRAIREDMDTLRAW